MSNASAAHLAARHIIRIDSHGGGLLRNLRELVQYRDLLLVLVLRDLQIRYRQSLLGLGWAILQPLVMMLVMTMFFGRLMDMEQYVGQVPYPVFVYAGLLPWTLFATAVTACSNAMIANAPLLRKVYVPRLALPLSAVGAPLVDFLIASTILAGLMVYYGMPFTWKLAITPLLLLCIVINVLGIGLWLASISVAYRDIRQVVPFLLQVGLLATPVIWPVSIVSERWQYLLTLNPMCGVVEAYRAAVLNQPLPWADWGMSLGVGGGLFFLGLWHFRWNERRFADIV